MKRCAHRTRAHSGIKRLRKVADLVRRRGAWVRDTVMVGACGLHNPRVRSPHRAYRTRPHANLPY